MEENTVEGEKFTCIIVVHSVLAAVWP